MSEKRRLEVEPPEAADRAVARALWMMEDTRHRTLEALSELPPEQLDVAPTGVPYGIGSLLYHIAIVEADWLYFEVLEADRFPAQIQALFPLDMRDREGNLSIVTGEPLESHLARLAAVRERLLATFRQMPGAEFYRPRELEHYLVTPEWVLYHLSAHEGEHRGQLQLIRWLVSPTSGTKLG